MKALFLFAGLVFLTGCNTEPTDSQVDPDALGAGNLEVWQMYGWSETNQPASVPNPSPILWFSPAGMQACMPTGDFTTCQLLFPKPLSLETLAADKYFFRGLEYIDRIIDVPNSLSSSWPGSTVINRYNPAGSAFPPVGWGEFRTKEQTRDSLAEMLVGDWYLASAMAARMAAKAIYDSAFGPFPGKGLLSFSEDSVRIQADSAGIPIGFQGAYAITLNEKIIAGGVPLPEMFMKDLPDLFVENTLRHSRINKPEHWTYIIGQDSMRFEMDYTCSCGARGRTIPDGGERVIFKRVPKAR